MMVGKFSVIFFNYFSIVIPCFYLFLLLIGSLYRRRYNVRS